MADNINLGKIVLTVEGQRNNINSIHNDINSYKNTLSEIPEQAQNMRIIYNISRKIRELESYKRSKSNNAELELLRQDLAQAQLNKNIHRRRGRQARSRERNENIVIGDYQTDSLL